MIVTVELDAEAEARLATGAQARGLSVEDYVRRVVSEAAGLDGDARTEQRRAAVDRMLEFASTHHVTLGAGGRIRDLLHQDHGI